MDFVADESVDFGIVKSLRQKEFKVFSVTEECSGISDLDVLNIAVKNKCLLLTEDKDFGELAVRLKYQHNGILLLRLNSLPRKERLTLTAETISLNLERLQNNFSVLNHNGLRIKLVNPL